MRIYLQKMDIIFKNYYLLFFNVVYLKEKRGNNTREKAASRIHLVFVTNWSQRPKCVCETFGGHSFVLSEGCHHASRPRNTQRFYDRN